MSFRVLSTAASPSLTRENNTKPTSNREHKGRDFEEEAAVGFPIELAKQFLFQIVAALPVIYIYIYLYKQTYICIYSVHMDHLLAYNAY